MKPSEKELMDRPTTIEAVLFDCDGVVSDTEPVSAEYNAQVYRALGAPVTAQDCLWLCGRDIVDIPTVAARYGVTITPEDYINKAEEMRATGELPESPYLLPELQLMPGVCDFLSSLRAKGIKTGLVSTTRAPHILLLLNRFTLASAFDVIITGDQVAHKKPHPEPYLKAMAYLDVDPANTIVIDDSPTGIAAGVASGAYVLGFEGSEVVQDTSAAYERLTSYAEFDLI